MNLKIVHILSFLPIILALFTATCDASKKSNYRSSIRDINTRICHGNNNKSIYAEEIIKVSANTPSFFVFF